MTIQQLFKNKKKMVRLANETGRELDQLIKIRYGFHYSETKDDRIIDTLDTGIDGISFEEFDKRMILYKEDFDSEKPFRTIA